MIVLVERPNLSVRCVLHEFEIKFLNCEKDKNSIRYLKDAKKS